MMRALCTLSILWISSFLIAQTPSPTLEYYLPAETYDSNIPTPLDYLGFDLGKWHLTHDQLVGYFKVVAAASDRITYTEYGRSYEDRPLVYLTITSEKNHQNLPAIQQEHLDNLEPGGTVKSEYGRPVVVYQGMTIHGNEPSGAHAAVALAYYLAASQTQATQDLLTESVILLDPCFNPDGFHRFSTWVNSNKGNNLVMDAQSRELNEPWPGGRTNHYWFDLNRDWLPVQHPESQGRIRAFHEWKPNVLTDHHEMGTNSTFFFQPGVPQRTNPLTPPMNQQLTEKIGRYHAKALDKVGSLYFTQERFDDYYYGKGSTYPDINGCIGILFEQASSRGHLQESVNGPVSFPFTIRNQFITTLSTLEASKALRIELLDYQRDFFRKQQAEAE
ncbi:MAG: M14 family zinc carboxypeptidase, partial [Bacteroidota bacterium]